MLSRISYSNYEKLGMSRITKNEKIQANRILNLNSEKLYSAHVNSFLGNPAIIFLRRFIVKQREQVYRQLSASLQERKLLMLQKASNGSESNDDTRNAQSVTSAKTKFNNLDLMCLTLEKEIEVLNSIQEIIPPTESIYSGEPDSLDGTSSEQMTQEDLGFHLPPFPNLQGKNGLDPVAMLELERCAHSRTRKELNDLKKMSEMVRNDFDSGEGMSETTSLLFNGSMSDGKTGTTYRQEQADAVPNLKPILGKSRETEYLEIDSPLGPSVTEIAKLHTALVQLGQLRDELIQQNSSLKVKLGEISSRISESSHLDRLNNNTPNLQECHIEKLQSESSEERKTLSSETSPTDEMKLKRKSTYKVSHQRDDQSEEISQLRSLVKELQEKESESQHQVSNLTLEVSNLRAQLNIADTVQKELSQAVRFLEEKLAESEKRLEVTQECLLKKDEEHSALLLDLTTLKEENKILKDQLNFLHHKVELEEFDSKERLIQFEKQLEAILEENKILQEDLDRERLLRKQYYNAIEELKGKIRVFCRIRPLPCNDEPSDLSCKGSDAYTVTVETSKGSKEFHFDRVFFPEDSQEQVFADTHNLIQSAFDGYNVCCVSYGQTGSGKTYTILGDDHNPGIAPRTFSEVFKIANEVKHKFDTTISFYVLELYNDKLIDLLSPHSNLNSLDSPDTNKLEIRRDRTGLVWISGARTLIAESSTTLEKAFRQAVGARHTAATRMNDRSSRSHLIIGLVIESRSRVNGTLLRGKISLLDLAGSERTGKSGVSAETMREANAINKSLSALGDVINALNTGQPFVPYRNNKLTLLMQDSIGGNAKTLMFVNISPSNYNLDETIVSLNFATRVKQITNGATRTVDSKEVIRLRSVISKLKRGENCVGEEDIS